MGLFDRFSAKKSAAPVAISAAEEIASVVTAPAPAEVSSGGVLSRLRAARERLDAKDLAGAVVIYDEVLKSAGDRADVLVTVSGDLGSTGHVVQIVELIAPRYDAVRHGPAAGFNLLQAYIAVRDGEAAQHVLDILFALNRPDLEERLLGFSNAIADLLLTGGTEAVVTGGTENEPGGASPAGVAKVGMVSISKPIWFYGLESLAGQILPPKTSPGRRVAFAQLALPGAYTDIGAAMLGPEDEMARLARGLPAWLAEIFYYTPAYAPVAAAAFVDHPSAARRPMLFSAEWTTENLRQLVDTTTGGLDYIFTGSLRQQSGDYELNLRLWEVKKYRERKLFQARWTPATVDAELNRLRQAVCQFMEWTPYPDFAYAAGLPPRAWIDVLAASLNLFLAKQKIFPTEVLPPLGAVAAILAEAAPQSVTASLAWLTLQARAHELGLAAGPADIVLAPGGLTEAAAVALRG